MGVLAFQARRKFLGASTISALGLNYPGILNAQTAPLTTRMSIAPRRQWDERNGYCGECSIQQAALFFGTYVSQYVCRAIINTNQQSQLLVAVNAQKVLTALKLNSAEFNYNGYASPQFQTYFGWVKQHLKLSHPVLITAFVKGLSDPDYDHIMLATGFTSSSPSSYISTDQLYFNDCFSSQVSIRTASTLNDVRSMLANGAKYSFCIPTKICYGCAVLGIQDTSARALPVSITLGSWTEPNVIAGVAPTTLSASVTVNGLTPGKNYSLFRYNDYRKVPTSNYTASAYSTIRNFVAGAMTATFTESLISNGVAIFRCVPAGS